jgi:hypothetical protein
MSNQKRNFSRKPNTQQVIAAIATVVINVILYVTVNAMFAVDLGMAGGSVVS